MAIWPNLPHPFETLESHNPVSKDLRALATGLRRSCGGHSAAWRNSAAGRCSAGRYVQASGAASVEWVCKPWWLPAIRFLNFLAFPRNAGHEL